MKWIRSSLSFANSNCVEIAWRKSGSSEFASNCVEAASVPDGYAPAKPGAAVLVRDSKNPGGPVLEFTAAEWDAFLAGARNGEFDSPA